MSGTHRSSFLVIVVLISFLSGWGSRLHAQNGFVVKNPCMGNPACDGDGVTFADTVVSATGWQWSFGDGQTGDARNEVHSYMSPGNYTVMLTRTLQGGGSETVSQLVEVGELPQDFQNWRTDTTICPGQTIELDPYPGGAPSGARFIWYPKGDTTQVLQVDSSGCYSVEAIMPNGCRIQNMINVKLCMEPSGNEGAKWYFGNGAGLDFQGGDPAPLTDGKLDTKEGTSVISNSKGELLFYSDGITIYNADGDKMPCFEGTCDDLRGSQDATQSVLIVPQPTCRGCEYLYNVFTTTSISATEKVLTVSVVDMRRENGKGAIIEQNRVLHGNATERLVSSRNDQDTTYWTISHDYGSNTFRIFHATTAGLVEVATFDGGLSHDTENRGEGQMKFSAADSTGQRQLAVVVPGPDRNYVDLFGFNDQDGSMSHTRTLDLGPSPPTAYGVEFSTDNTKLYVTFMGGSGTDSKLVQYDLNAADDSLIVASAMTIDSSRTLIFGSLQAAPNGKIYMAIQGSEYLAVIGEPNDTTRILSRLEYEREGVRLGGKHSQLGLPNFVQNFTNPSDGPGFSAEGFCVNEPTNFTASPLCDPIEDNYTWDFGDGTGMTGKETEVTHTYTAPGIYKVTLLASNKCLDTLFTQEIEIFDVPEESGLERYIEICANEYKLNPTVDAKNYVWVDTRLNRIVSRDRVHTVYPPGGDFLLFMWNDPLAECLFIDTVSVVMRRPPPLDLGPDLAMCRDSSITVSTPGQSWREFLWSNGETSRDLTVTQPGTYWVEAKDANECVNRDTIQVVERPKPRITAELTGPTGCTTSDGVITIRNITPGTIPDYIFAWSDVSGASLGTGSVLLDRREGAYTLRMSGYDDACVADTTLHLRSPANNLNLRPVVTDASCTDPEGGQIAFQVVSGNPSEYVWYNEAGAELGRADTVAGLPRGVYSMLARDAGGCTFTMKPIVVGMIMNNLADLGPDVAKCEDDAVELAPLAVDFPHNSYLWSTGETTHTITVTEAGTYKLTAFNTENGCKGEDEIVVRQAPKPAVGLPEEYGLCMDEPDPSVTLKPTGRPGYLYYWPQVADSSQQITVTQLGAYTVMVTNAEGCTIEKTTEVLDKCEPRLVIPSAFSPDGNGINDVLDIIGLYLTDFDLKIYNRWGEVIFASSNLDHKWDGRYKDVKVQPGVYAYVATYRSSDYPQRPKYKVRGSVTVVR